MKKFLLFIALGCGAVSVTHGSDQLGAGNQSPSQPNIFVSKAYDLSQKDTGYPCPQVGCSRYYIDPFSAYTHFKLAKKGEDYHMVNIETNNWSDFFPLPEIEKERLEDTGHLSLVACYLYPYGCPSIFSRDQPLDRDVHEAKAKHQVTHDGLLKMLARVDGRAECAGDAEALSNFLDKEVNTGKKPKKPGGHTPKKSKQKASRGQK